MGARAGHLKTINRILGLDQSFSMEESIDIPDLDEIQDLGSAKVLLKLVLKTAEHQTQTITQKIAELERSLFGKKSERVVPVDKEIRQKQREEETPEQREARLEAQRLRREASRDKRRDEAEIVIVPHPAPDTCEKCGLSLEDADELGPEVSEEYEYVPLSRSPRASSPAKGLHLRMLRDRRRTDSRRRGRPVRSWPARACRRGEVL